MSSLQDVAGLQSPVDLWRDAQGVPHIRAQTSTDAFFALGYVHATDRLWQMDALRRRAIGRYAEWVGPSALPMDMLVRRMGIAQCAQRDAVAANSETRAMLAAYTAGVNAFMQSGTLSREYTLLGETPEPWQDWHCIAVLRQTGLLLNSVYPKLWRAIALPVVGAAAIGSLRMDDGGDELTCLPSEAPATRLVPDMAALVDALAALMADAPADAAGGGSNNWAVHGSRTASGKPLVAGDPHRLLDMPNMYLQCHLACDAFDVIGLTSPGVPGFPHFAHNEHVAWCVTVAFVDTADIYLERFQSEGHRYLAKADADGRGHAEWGDTEHRVEQIKVRGQASVDCDVFVTARGPVVAGDPRAGTALVLRHSADVEVDHALDCMLPMMRATSVDALFEACRGWGLVDHNVVAGDTAGHIGHHVRAKVARRPSANGWLPVPGWIAQNAWRDWITWEQMPRQIDPAQGLIVTANNRVVARHADYLTTDCHPPHRARRILQRLQALEASSVADMESVHRDTLSLPARELCARLARLDLTDKSASALRDRLVAWDGHVSATSAEANAYQSLRIALCQAVARLSGLARIDVARQRTVPPGLGIQYQLNWCLPQLLRADDTTLLGGSTWNTVLAEALKEVAHQPDAAWGTRHHVVLRHPLANVFPAEPLYAPRDIGAVDGDNETVFTTGFVPHAFGTHCAYSSIARYVFDLNDWEACRWIAFHGASGDPANVHYDDQSETWRRGETVPMRYDWAGIASAAMSHTVLQPANTLAAQTAPQPR